MVNEATQRMTHPELLSPAPATANGSSRGLSVSSPDRGTKLAPSWRLANTWKRVNWNMLTIQVYRVSTFTVSM
jgi:hypothetical protein